MWLIKMKMVPLEKFYIILVTVFLGVCFQNSRYEILNELLTMSTREIVHC